MNQSLLKLIELLEKIPERWTRLYIAVDYAERSHISGTFFGTVQDFFDRISLNQVRTRISDGKPQNTNYYVAGIGFEVSDQSKLITGKDYEEFYWKVYHSKQEIRTRYQSLLGTYEPKFRIHGMSVNTLEEFRKYDLLYFLGHLGKPEEAWYTSLEYFHINNEIFEALIANRAELLTSPNEVERKVAEAFGRWLKE